MKIPFTVALLLAGCGGTSATPPPPHRDDAAIARPDAAQGAVTPARPLGLPDLAAWQWRSRAGHPAFRTARKAESHDDWAGVVAACTQALAADPTNLEAAWLLAVGDAKLGKLDAVTAPLQLAGAGDFGKWALASLDQPGLQPYLATPAGQAWQRRVEADRGPFLTALARGLIVIAKGDLYAVADQRWYRLTRTYGGVVAAFAPVNGHVLAYVTRGKTSHKLAVGSVDLATGMTTRSQELAPVATQLAATRDGAGIWIGQQGGKPRVLSLAGDEHRGLLVPTKLARPAGAWLELYASGGVRLHRVPAGVSADWDDQGLASAIRIATSNRVVTVPGQIQGDSIVWSPDRNHLALVAQTSDHCDAATPSVTAYAIDTATGAATELSRGHGLAIDWMGDRAVAIAGDDGVKIRELGGATTPLVGATNLVHPRFAPKCEALPTEAPAESPLESDDEPAEN
ncbi:MAG TPA: hypothetical protein VFQ65_07390 [Kofleriaceae bacterium]|nr:hypothetical protein [Kofleriaceae bacterium]